ncbi:MAG TPA: glycosyltransferase [Porticoccaceae bacterium]|nr:glycosyltransferase [Porticoccaceae bacterium]HCO59767.1 glycosyltransferase [Porticoccaceae bacterium]
MRILYGVQGTGNGHITRARAMAPALAAEGVDVDYLFSGREPEQFFDMEPFGDYQLRRGLTMVVEAGRAKSLKTLYQARPLTFLREVRSLDVSDYDLVLTDFEPVTAWAGKQSKVPVLGLGHQYAFLYPIPQHYGGLHHRLIMKYFAPADCSLGFHWYHFDAPILPPMAPIGPRAEAPEERLIVVYLPFEDVEQIDVLLSRYPDYRFEVFHPKSYQSQHSHIQWRLPSREGFHDDLRRCGGVFCNAGFGLASEVLQLGCKLLVKPVHGQSEQLSNVIALRQVGLAHALTSLDDKAFGRWLREAEAKKVRYPDVASAVAKWIATGRFGNIDHLAASLWRKTRFPEKPLASACTLSAQRLEHSFPRP